MSKKQVWVRGASPEKEVPFIASIPARHLSHSTRVSSYITLKDSPEWECRRFDFPFFAKSTKQARGEKLA
jgi:hypothetical protein